MLFCHCIKKNKFFLIILWLFLMYLVWMFYYTFYYLLGYLWTKKEFRNLRFSLLSCSKGNLSGDSVQIFLSFSGDNSREFLEFAFLVLLYNLDCFKLLKSPTDHLSWSRSMAFGSISILGTSTEMVLEVTNTPVTANKDFTGKSGNSDIQPIRVKRWELSTSSCFKFSH